MEIYTEHLQDDSVLSRFRVVDILMGNVCQTVNSSVEINSQSCQMTKPKRKLLAWVQKSYASSTVFVSTYLGTFRVQGLAETYMNATAVLIVLDKTNGKSEENIYIRKTGL